MTNEDSANSDDVLEGSSLSDFVTILQLRVLGLVTCKYHESQNENCESQNFGSRELLYCIVFVLFTVYVNSL